jgi:hypothetical protein
MVTGREAGRMLREVVSTEERARLLLGTGIIGRGLWVGKGVLFEAGDVEALRRWPGVDEQELAGVCPHGVVVV